MKPEEFDRSGNSGGDKNVMPSMVVRQQKNQLLGIYQRPASATGCEQSSTATGNTTNNNNNNNNITTSTSSIVSTSSLLLEAAKRTQQPQSQQQQQQFDQNGLVIPKRVPHHPVFADQPTIRDLNRELKFNQVRGNNVLDKKSELRKALETLEESKRKKEAEQERLNRRTSLEMRLEERAERIARETNSQRPQSAVSPAETSESMVATDSCVRPSATTSSNFSIRSLR